MSQNNPIIYAGLDVAKHSLALDFRGRAYSLENDARGHARLVKILGVEENVHVVLEATGGYEQPAVRTLHAAGIALSVVEPRRVRSLAEAMGRRAKTDPIDAAVLTAFGEATKPPPTAAPSEQQQHLAQLALRRRQLVGLCVAERNRSEHYTHQLLRRQAAALLLSLRRQIAACDNAIARQIQEDEDLAARAARLQQVPGVGPVSAATFLAEMPELGTLSDQGAAALAGLAPYNCDSGARAGARRIRGGRHPVRCALYMCAMSAVRHDAILKAFYQRLRAAGKKPLVALTAVMRKLVVLLNRLLKKPDFQLRGAA